MGGNRHIVFRIVNKNLNSVHLYSSKYFLQFKTQLFCFVYKKKNTNAAHERKHYAHCEGGSIMLLGCITSAVKQKLLRLYGKTYGAKHRETNDVHRLDKFSKHTTINLDLRICGKTWMLTNALHSLSLASSVHFVMWHAFVFSLIEKLWINFLRFNNHVLLSHKITLK